MPGERNFRWVWIPLVVIAVDQVTKLAVHSLMPEEHIRVIIPGFLNLVHRHNPGVAFGMLADSESPLLTRLLLLFSTGAICLLAWLLSTGRAGDARSRTGLALILGGAAGNAVDRLVHSSVIDFVNFYVGRWHWPAFNVADSCIVIGAGLVILDLLMERPHSEKESSERSAGA